MTRVKTPRQIFALSTSTRIFRLLSHATVIRNECCHIFKNACEPPSRSNENCAGLMHDHWIMLMVHEMKSNCQQCQHLPKVMKYTLMHFLV